MLKFHWSALEEDITPIRRCDKVECDLEGEYPAPRSPHNLQDRYYFCLDHIKEYNAGWNYYAHMNDDEAEKSRIDDMVWERPSWPFGSGRRAHFRPAFDWQRAQVFDSIGILKDEDESPHRCFNQESSWFKPRTKEQKALELLSLPFPFTREQLKGAYKSLAKQHHPDLNADTPDALERFRAIKDAYELLLKTLEEVAA
jgi:DnaJ-class molecular chaperone with C-terminal Zn finger domain